MPSVNFSVDSALLKELGERLVGKPYIALAELVKNGYDADASKVKIKLDSINDEISIIDDGHGMSQKEFETLWMRVGSTHKEKLRFSRKLGRLMTGSKGVGRLAVQFLAKSMVLETTSENDTKSKLVANIVWEKAVNHNDLNKVRIDYDIKNSSSGFSKGTCITLNGLKHRWGRGEIEGLASELWWLQPPFRESSDLSKSINKNKEKFRIEFDSPFPAYKSIFNEEMGAILDIWIARIIGSNNNGKVDLTLEFAGEDPVSFQYIINDCKLSKADWEIRIYNLVNRQPHKIKVDQARKYFANFGGVHVYDSGFHLPYYGNPLNDWLKIEIDHSHRLTLSKLLPKELQVKQGMTFLPTLSRIFGVVNVDTSQENNLKILITRDRLQEAEAFQSLREMVRYGLDLYAMQEKKRSLKQSNITAKIKPLKVKAFDETLEKYKTEISEDVYRNLKKDIDDTTQEFQTQAEQTAQQVSLVGPLATAGISSLAYQHELTKQFGLIDDIVLQLSTIKVPNVELQNTLGKLTKDLSSWVSRARATNSLFAYFASSENSQTKQRFSVKKVIDDVKNQVKILSRDTIIDTTSLDPNLYLPKASLTEWGAVFQNIFINSFNAVVDTKEKLIKVSSRVKWDEREILIQDTGVGVNLDAADTLFQPFVRKMIISEERKSLGYGGMGLGLTIVRLIANNIGCKVRFVEPEDEFRTAFSLSWREEF